MSNDIDIEYNSMNKTNPPFPSNEISTTNLNDIINNDNIVHDNAENIKFLMKMIWIICIQHNFIVMKVLHFST